MSDRIPTIIAEGEGLEFPMRGSSGSRGSLDSLGSSLQNEHEDTSLSLNDDLASVGTGGNGYSGSRASRRSFESSSVFTSSFRPSFDDSFPSLGLNKLSIQRVSPLGPNSIYELIADVDSRRVNSTLSPNINRANAKGKLSILPPTQKDIPQVQLSKLGKIPKDQFKEYLVEFGKEFDRYNANKRLTTDTLHTLAKKHNSTANLLDEEFGALETIPDVYFSDDFNLDDPRIFKMATEGQNIENLNEVLQEKLSWYLDTIEVHLVNEISKSSGSFFDALNDLNDINDKNVKTVGLIDELREKLKTLQKSKIEHNLKRLELQQRRENASKLEQSLIQISTVMQQSDVAEALFLEAEYEKCLDKVDYVENLLKGESYDDDDDLKWPYPLQDVRDIPALSNLRELLCKLRSQTGDSYASIFSDYLMTDLRSHYEGVDHTKVMERLVTGANYQPVINDDFKTTLTEYIIGLTRCEGVATAFKSYEESVVAEMKNVVRVFLPNEETVPKDQSVASSSVNARPTSLSGLLKAMTPREFEVMLIKIYTTCAEGLRRLTVHQKLLLDLALNYMTGKEEDQASLIMQLDIRPCIKRSIEIIQLRMSKIINVRTELNSTLRYDFFLRMFYINTVFLNECESISGLNFKTLPDKLAEQVRAFNNAFQNTNLKRVSQSLEVERWQPVIVSLSSQETVNKMLENKNLDVEQAWKSELSHINNEVSDSSNGREDETNEGESHKKSIVVGDKTFVASSSLLLVISIIRDLLLLKSNFPHYSNVYESFVTNVVDRYKNQASLVTKRAPEGAQINLSIVTESLDCIDELLVCISQAQGW